MRVTTLDLYLHKLPLWCFVTELGHLRFDKCTEGFHPSYPSTRLPRPIRRWSVSHPIAADQHGVPL